MAFKQNDRQGAVFYFFFKSGLVKCITIQKELTHLETIPFHMADYNLDSKHECCKFELSALDNNI